MHGRELALKLEVDGRVARNPAAHVVLLMAAMLAKGARTRWQS